MAQRMSGPQAVGMLLLAIFVGTVSYFWTRPGVFDKMWVAVSNDPSFWVIMVLGVAWTIYRFWKNPNRLLAGEAIIQGVVSVTFTLMFAHMFYFETSDFKALEFWNGNVAYVQYAESYEDEVCTTDEDGNQDCSCSYTPPSWTIYTNNQLRRGTPEFQGTNSSVYRNYVGLFRNERVVGSNGDIACDTGNVYQTTYRGADGTLVPTAITHPYVNYFRASKSIRKVHGDVQKFRAHLVDYPQQQSGTYGAIELMRVIHPSSMRIDRNWKQTVDEKLDVALTKLGARKQANILVYLVPTTDDAFFHALEEHWLKGQKNDVIVVIGVDQSSIVHWAEIMAWTKVEAFKVDLASEIVEMGNIGDADKLADTILKYVSKPGGQGGYVRTPMEELKYLAADAEISWFAVFLLLLAMVIVNALTSYALENNEIGDKYGANRWRGGRFDFRR